MNKTATLIALSALVYIGCASMEQQLTLPKPATAEDVTVTLPDSSSFRFTSPDRVEAVARHLGQLEEGWQKRWRFNEDARYRVDIEQSTGEVLTFSVHRDALSFRDKGVSVRKLSEEELRELDREILGENPYQRFASLDFDYPSD